MQNLPTLLERIDKALTPTGLYYEVIIVNDDPSETEAIEKLADFKNNLKIIHRPTKLGVASAVIDGIKNANYDYILVRNSDFLNWRFCDSRNSNYRIIQAHDENDILGYCVTRINRLIKGYPEGFIVDVITEPKRKDVAKALIFDAISHCDEQGVNAISCLMVNKNTYNDILLNYGFVNSRSNFNVGLREVTPSIRNDLQKLYSANPDRIDYQYAHTDWI